MPMQTILHILDQQKKLTVSLFDSKSGIKLDSGTVIEKCEIR